MIQNSTLIKRQESLNINVNACTKKPLLKKSRTVEQAMMDEFLARQKLYDNINGPIMKLEQQKFNPPKIETSKLRDAVHQARKRYAEFQEKKKESHSRAQKSKISSRMNDEANKIRDGNEKIVQIPKKTEIYKIHSIILICGVLVYLTIIQIINWIK